MKNAESYSSIPSIAFPLGFIFLSILLFCISGFLISCVNWHKLQSLILRSSDDENHNTRSDTDHSPPDVQPAASLVKKARQKQVGQGLPVLMPGDEVPRFLAMACPCEPATLEKFKITAKKPPLLPVSIGSLPLE